MLPNNAWACALPADSAGKKIDGGKLGALCRWRVIQPVLVVLSESGDAVAVAANPDKHEELGRFQAVSGKTWNHPVIAHGRLFTRNGEELACFELKPAE